MCGRWIGRDCRDEAGTGDLVRLQVECERRSLPKSETTTSNANLRLLPCRRPLLPPAEPCRRERTVAWSGGGRPFTISGSHRPLQITGGHQPRYRRTTAPREPAGLRRTRHRNNAWPVLSTAIEEQIPQEHGGAEQDETQVRSHEDCRAALNAGLLQSRCKPSGLRRLSIGDIKRDENIGILGARAESDRRRR